MMGLRNRNDLKGVDKENVTILEVGLERGRNGLKVEAEEVVRSCI